MIRAKYNVVEPYYIEGSTADAPVFVSVHTQVMYRKDVSYFRRVENVLEHIHYVENQVNKNLAEKFSKYLITKDASANYQRNCIKIMLMFAELPPEPE